MDKIENFSAEYSLRRNQVNIFHPIDDALAELVIAQIQYLDDKGVDEITVQINSPGGSVTAGMAIYDTLNYSKARIVTVGVGMCASMGAFLLSAGSKGYRRATENCEILIHQPLGGASGQASDIIIAAEHISRTRDNLNRNLDSVAQSRSGVQMSFFQLDDPVLSQIRDEILNIDINNLTPMEALNKLHGIKGIITGKKE